MDMKRNGRNGIIMLLIAALVLAADQMIKNRIRGFPLNTTIADFYGVLRIVRRENGGLAFGFDRLGPETTRILVCTAFAAVILWEVRSFRQTGSPVRALLFGLVDGGALGNLADRLVYGTVTDYIRFVPVRFPVFNLADVCLTAGFGFLILMILRDR